MKKYTLSIVAILIAVTLVAMKSPVLIKPPAKKAPIEFCFEYVGIKNSQEGDVTKWEEVTIEKCIALSCGRFRFGCKIKVTSKQIINNVPRPANVYLAPGTNDPVTGPTVTSVSNADD